MFIDTQYSRNNAHVQIAEDLNIIMQTSKMGYKYYQQNVYTAPSLRMSCSLKDDKIKLLSPLISDKITLI